MQHKKMGCTQCHEYIDRRAKSWFSRICNSMKPSSNSTKFTLKMQGKPHSKFRENFFNHSGDMSNQTFKKFFNFFTFFSYTLQKLLQLTDAWLKYSTLVGVQRQISASNFEQIQQKFWVVWWQCSPMFFSDYWVYLFRREA